MREMPSSAHNKTNVSNAHSMPSGARERGPWRRRTWHALKQADVEANLVPLHRRAHDLHKRQGDLRVPLLGRLEDEVVQGLADLRVLAVVLQVKQA